MPKLMIHNSEARKALARGVAQIAAAVEPTLGPKGLNAMIDRPIGTPLITRDGVSIASEIELFDRFENMGAQVVREVSMQTNEVAGDGTTTAIVLANALVQSGVEAAASGVKTVDLCKGIDLAVEEVVKTLLQSAKDVKTDERLLKAVATIAATDEKLGNMVAEAHARIGDNGIITTDYGVTTETTMELIEGMSFDRGYISHHMVTDQDKMEAVIQKPLILLTDLKILAADALDNVIAIAEKEKRPLVIFSEEVSPEVVMRLLEAESPGKYLIVHPPEYGHWRKAMMDDIAILTGGKVIARDLGGKLEKVKLEELGSADKIISSASHTTILRGDGKREAISARREQVQRQFDVAPPNIEQDKLRERLAKLSGGTAIIYAGGVTPVEQKRTIQLIEDSLNAVRVAYNDGVVAGGGTAFLQADKCLDKLEKETTGDVAKGVGLVRSVLSRPISRIVTNAGGNPEEVINHIRSKGNGHGYNAANGEYMDMLEAGVVDPVRVSCSALINASSVAKLILTTETLVGDLEEDEDPTEGPCRGGGSENLGRA